jgi:hypothetical protein
MRDVVERSANHLRLAFCNLSCKSDAPRSSTIGDLGAELADLRFAPRGSPRTKTRPARRDGGACGAGRRAGQRPHGPASASRKEVEN